MAEVKKQSLEEMQAQIAELQAKLGVSEAKRTEAEEMAHALSSAGQFIARTAEEQPTGKTTKVSVCLNPTEKNAKHQKFKEIEYPTYYYTIDLPAAAGLFLSTNGVEYYHGETYEFDPIMLAEMKSRVARCWDHEKSIHSDNENAYRKPTAVHLKSKGVR